MSVVINRKFAPGAAYLEQVVARAEELLREPLSLGRSGRLVLRRGFAPVPAAPVRTWSATGRFYVTGPHLAKVASVELQLSEYSAESLVLEVRPVSQKVRRWGKWRYERYFDLAHYAADALANGLRQAGGAATVLLSTS